MPGNEWLFLRKSKYQETKVCTRQYVSLFSFKNVSRKSKPAQVTFTTRRDIRAPVNLHNTHIPVKKEVKCLGLHLDEKLTWKTHKAKGCQLEFKLKNVSWLINTRSQLSLDSKLTVYKTILRHIWTYGIELWGYSKPSNTKILQTFQSKMIRMISSAP